MTLPHGPEAKERPGTHWLPYLVFLNLSLRYCACSCSRVPTPAMTCLSVLYVSWGSSMMNVEYSSCSGPSYTDLLPQASAVGCVEGGGSVRGVAQDSAFPNHVSAYPPLKLLLPLREKKKGHIRGQTLSSLDNLWVGCGVKVSPVHILRPHLPSLGILSSPPHGVSFMFVKPRARQSSQERRPHLRSGLSCLGANRIYRA